VRSGTLKRLADLCEVITKGTTPTTLGFEFSDKGIGFLRVQNIEGGRVNYEKDTLFIPEKTHEALERSQIRPGDVLVSIAGTIGRSALVPENAPPLNCNQAVAIVRTNGSVFRPFLRQWLASSVAQAQMRSAMVTGTISNLSLTQIGNLQIPLPPLSKQRRIAEVLEQVEDLRAKRCAALAQLGSLTQAIFADLFGNPETNSKGWPETQSLGDVADIVSGVTKGRKLDGKPTKEVPYMTVANVQDRSLNLTSVKLIDATEDEIRRYRLLPEDLLLTEGGDPDKLGRGTLWNNEIPECIHQNHVFRVRLTSKEMHPLFLNWLVGSTRGKRYFLRAAKQTTGIASINMTQLRGFPLLLPPLALQRDFARRVAAVEKLKVLHRASLAKLDALFASLQRRAFRGEL
jgi:type I restriction enzyme S subunit